MHQALYIVIFCFWWLLDSSGTVLNKRFFKRIQNFPVPIEVVQFLGGPGNGLTLKYFLSRVKVAQGCVSVPHYCALIYVSKTMRESVV